MRLLLLLMLPLFAGTRAWAEDPKLAVLEAVGPGPPERLAHLTDVARAAIQAARPDVLVLTRENLEALLPPGVALADCDAECEVDAGREVGADWVLAIRFDPTPPARVTATLYDTGVGLLVGHGAAMGDDEAAVRAACETVASTWRAQSPAPNTSADAPPYGTLDLSALSSIPELENVAVRIDGLPVPPQTRTPMLRVGRHEIRLQHPCRHVRPGAVYITPGGTTRVPLEALLRCRVVRVESNQPDAAIRLGDTLRPLPQRLLLPTDRTEVFKVPGGASIERTIPRDAAAVHVVDLPTPILDLHVTGRYRNGRLCAGRLRIDGASMGRLPWSGRVTRGEHHLEADCNGARSKRVTINTHDSITLAEPFGTIEGYTQLSENASLLTVGGRLWTPRLIDMLHLGVGIQAGSVLRDGPTTFGAFEVLVAVPLRWIDLVVVPTFGSQGALRTFARARFGPFSIDLGVGLRGNGDASAGGFLLGLGYIQ